MSAMTTTLFTSTLVCLTAYLLTCVPAQGQPVPPLAQDNVVDVFFGDTVPDPYRWLEDDRDVRVTQWVAHQGERTRSELEALPARPVLRKRLGELMAYDKIGGFDRVNGVLYYRHQSANEQHSRLMRKQSNGVEDTLLDPNTWSADGTTTLSTWSVSNDGQWLGYGVNEAGSDWTVLRVMRLTDKRVLDDELRWVKVSGIGWHNNGFFYSRYPAPSDAQLAYVGKNENHSVWYHVPGTLQEQDQLVFEDTSKPDYFNFAWVPEGTDHLMRSSRRGGSYGTSLFVKSWSDTSSQWKVLYVKDSVSVGIIDVIADTLYAITDHDTPRKKIIRVVNFLRSWNEEVVVPESNDVLVGATYREGRLIVTYMRDVYNFVQVISNTGRVLHNLALPTKGAVSGFAARRSDSTFLYTFSSYTYPPVTYAYNIAENRSTQVHATNVPFDPNRIRVQQEFVRSKDGTMVPLTLLRMDNVGSAKNRPTMLYGYGGFNITQGPSFNPLIVAWLEQGGTYAVANLRGGGEYGKEWHLAGTTVRKQNVFDDAIACAEWLIARGETSPQRLAINGRSNGGLLVGALMVQRPDLFAVAIPEVGVLDMLRYHLFTIGWNWTGDYGSVDNKDEYRALRAYSPYHNLRTGIEYPATLIMTADHDDRVVPAHSFKFAAQLQNVYKGQRPMLMRVETRSGHGAVNLEIMLDGVADKWAFALANMR